MKLIVYEPDPKKAHRFTEQLRHHGHEVVAWADRMERLAHLIGEFDARCLVVSAIDADLAPRCPLAAGACAPSLHQWMVAQGYRVLTAPRLWEAALPLCRPGAPSEELVRRAAGAFRRFMISEPLGLSRLPLPWLAALPGILERLARPSESGKIACFAAGVAAKHGFFEVEFHQEEHWAAPGRRSLRMEIRKALNKRCRSQGGRSSPEKSEEVDGEQSLLSRDGDPLLTFSAHVLREAKRRGAEDGGWLCT